MKPPARFIVSPEIVGLVAILFLLGALILAWGPE